MLPENNGAIKRGWTVPNSADSTLTIDNGDGGSLTSNAVTPNQGVLPQKTVSTYNYKDKSNQ